MVCQIRFPRKFLENAKKFGGVCFDIRKVINIQSPCGGQIPPHCFI